MQKYNFVDTTIGVEKIAMVEHTHHDEEDEHKNIIILIINMKIKMDTLMKMMDLIHIFG